MPPIKNPYLQPLAQPERRAGGDRRLLDGEPPGRHERRRRLEARQPEVSEIQVSPDEWRALSDAMPGPRPFRAASDGAKAGK